MECKQEENKENCNCTYEPCSKKGICCECIKFHLANRELPACCFPDDVEKTYDRSFERFAEIVNNKKI
ncbi:MAG: cytosolic protein [Nanoarchaeota archaeon]|nr:cytosolic protein [Nanoarchaeota archaeon]